MVDYGYFKFNNAQSGKGSLLGIVLSKPIEISGAVPNVVKESVPGRNGDVVFWDGTYENRTADIVGYVEGRNVVDAVSDINSLLQLHSQEYFKFQTQAMAESGTPTFFLARCARGAELQSANNGLAKVSLRLDLQPQMFFVEGEAVIGVDVPGETPIELYNLSNFPAEPNIVVDLKWAAGTGSECYMLINNEVVLTFINTGTNGNRSARIIYDAITGRIVRTTGSTSLYAVQEFDKKVQLSKGLIVPNTLSFSGETSAIDNVKITPRWWTL